MFSAGQQIGEYLLMSKLGKGGFGEVWLAQKKSQFFTKRVAVKLPHDEQVNFEAIRREAELWEQASGHPNVLPIIDAGVYDGQVVIVSEYADGGSLADKLKLQGKLPINQAIELTIGILNGLEFLHSKQIIHRDIKPQNILLQGNTPRVADFGISRAMNTSTISSVVVGTDAYMSPESFDGRRSVQTDIWSVGVVLYQLLAGNLPFPQEHPSERIFAILTKEFPPLPDDVPNSLQGIVAKALAKLPENRYRSANEIGAELKLALVGIEHPTLAKTEILQVAISNQTITEVSKIDKLFKTEEPEKETVVNNLQTPVTTLPPVQPESIQTQFKQVNFTENKPLPTEVQKFADKMPNNRHMPQNPLVTTPQIQKKSVADIFKQENITSPNQPSKAGLKIGGIMIGVLVLGLIPAIIVGGYYLLNSTYISQSMLPPIESSQLIPFRKGNKWGYSDAQKRIYIAPQFINAKPFSEDLALVGIGYSNSYIDKTGKIVIQGNLKTKYSESFKEGLAKVSVNDGLIKAELDEKIGFIDKSGNMVIQPKYYSAESFSEGLAMVCFEETANKVKIYPDCGFVDKSGSEVIPLKYFNVHSFSEGSAAVKDKTTAQKVSNPKGETYYIGDKVIFLDKSGKVILSLSESLPEMFFPQFSEGLSAIKGTDSGVRFIDKSGKVIIQTEYLRAGPFSEGLAGVSKSVDNNEKYGFIDRTGKLLIPLQYDSVGDFSEGLAAVKSNGKVGFIDKTGKVVIPLKYEDSFLDDLKFKNGIVKVKLGDKDFYIGKDGTEYYEP